MLNSTKIEKVGELNSKFLNARIGIIAEYKGLTVKQLTDFRKDLRNLKTASEFRVVKNTLAKKATKDTPFEKLGESFSGPTSLTLGFTENDIILLPKVMINLAKKETKFKIIAAVVDGKLISAEGIKQLSESPSKEELLRMILGSMQSPVVRLVTTLNGVISNLINVLNRVKENRK
jgi:large subunit ribosomal protein L10